MIRLFGRHRVRSTFYHTISAIFLLSTVAWYFGFLSDKVSYMITAILFITDYIAEMYDPHPENPGPWFKTHFHRVVDNGDSDDEFPCEYDKAYKKILASKEFDHLWSKVDDDRHSFPTSSDL